MRMLFIRRDILWMLLFFYEEYPQVQPNNPLYSNRSTVKTEGSSSQPSNSRSSATLVNRRQKFDPQAPRRPSDWRWLAILCIILFFPLGMFIAERTSPFRQHSPLSKVYSPLHSLVKHRADFAMVLSPIRINLTNVR